MSTGGLRAGFVLSGLVHFAVAVGWLAVESDDADRPAQRDVIELQLSMFQLPDAQLPPQLPPVEEMSPPAVPPEAVSAEPSPPRDDPPAEPEPVVVEEPKPRPKKVVRAKPRLASKRRSDDKPSTPRSSAKVVARPADDTPKPPVPVTSVDRAIQLVDQESIRQSYLTALTRAIHRNKYYPSRAKRRREQGSVVVTFSITKDGSLNDIRVTSSSSIARLDRAALKTIRRLSPFKPIPDALNRYHWSVSVPIEFRLR